MVIKFFESFKRVTLTKKFDKLLILNIIVAGEFIKKERVKMDFTAGELNIVVPLAIFLYGEKQVRKMFHIRRNYVLLVLLGIGLCLFFFSIVAIAMIILYVLSLSVNQ